MCIARGESGVVVLPRPQDPADFPAVNHARTGRPARRRRRLFPSPRRRRRRLRSRRRLRRQALPSQKGPREHFLGRGSSLHLDKAHTNSGRAGVRDRVIPLFIPPSSRGGGRRRGRRNLLTFRRLPSLSTGVRNCGRQRNVACAAVYDAPLASRPGSPRAGWGSRSAWTSGLPSTASPALPPGWRSAVHQVRPYNREPGGRALKVFLLSRRPGCRPRCSRCRTSTCSTSSGPHRSCHRPPRWSSTRRDHRGTAPAPRTTPLLYLGPAPAPSSPKAAEVQLRLGETTLSFDPWSFSRRPPTPRLGAPPSPPPPSLPAAAAVPEAPLTPRRSSVPGARLGPRPRVRPFHTVSRRSTLVPNVPAPRPPSPPPPPPLRPNLDASPTATAAPSPSRAARAPSTGRVQPGPPPAAPPPLLVALRAAA